MAACNSTLSLSRPVLSPTSSPAELRSAACEGLSAALGLLAAHAVTNYQHVRPAHFGALSELCLAARELLLAADRIERG